MHPISRLIPIHGALDSSLPALEDRDVFLTGAVSTAFWGSFGQEGLVGGLQLLQLFLGLPEACSDSGGQWEITRSPMNAE